MANVLRLGVNLIDEEGILSIPNPTANLVSVVYEERKGLQKTILCDGLF